MQTGEQQVALPLTVADQQIQMLVVGKLRFALDIVQTKTTDGQDVVDFVRLASGDEDFTNVFGRNPSIGVVVQIKDFDLGLRLDKQGE